MGTTHTVPVHDKLPACSEVPDAADFVAKRLAQRNPRLRDVDTKALIGWQFVKELEQSGFLKSLKRNWPGEQTRRRWPG